jgi:hypothetical protein
MRSASLEKSGLRETILSLRSGYPAGAMARWRLLREADVLSLFLGAQERETAQAFLDHSILKASKRPKRHDYRRWARHVGEQQLAEDEMGRSGSVGRTHSR